MWRRTPDRADDVLDQLSALRKEIEALRSRVNAFFRTERRSVNRRHSARPAASDRRRPPA